MLKLLHFRKYKVYYSVHKKVNISHTSFVSKFLGRCQEPSLTYGNSLLLLLCYFFHNYLHTFEQDHQHNTFLAKVVFASIIPKLCLNRMLSMWWFMSEWSFCKTLECLFAKHLRAVWLCSNCLTAAVSLSDLHLLCQFYVNFQNIYIS